MLKMDLMLLALLVLLAATSATASRRNRTANQQRRKSLPMTSLTRQNRGRSRTTTTAATLLDAEDGGGDGGRLASDQPGVETCEVARLKCAYRVGCGMALQNYMIGCSDVMTGSTKKCSDHCRNSLIALTSTEEGEALMKCKCSDAFCMDAKRRIDICRPAVQRATNNTAVSCSVAQWICLADPVCSTALDYYNQFCRSMFAGKKCTLRCKNSISILRRQEKAAKLSSCVCDGSEDYDCPAILNNMERLCFHHQRPPPVPHTTTPPLKPRPHHHPKPPRPHHTSTTSTTTTTTTTPAPPVVEIESNEVEVRRPVTSHVTETSVAPPPVTSPPPSSSSPPPPQQFVAPLFCFLISVHLFL